MRDGPYAPAPPRCRAPGRGRLVTEAGGARVPPRRGAAANEHAHISLIGDTDHPAAPTVAALRARGYANVGVFGDYRSERDQRKRRFGGGGDRQLRLGPRALLFALLALGLPAWVVAFDFDPAPLAALGLLATVALVVSTGDEEGGHPTYPS